MKENTELRWLYCCRYPNPLLRASAYMSADHGIMLCSHINDCKNLLLKLKATVLLHPDVQTQ